MGTIGRGQANRERTAFSRLALYPNAPAVAFHDEAANGQAQTSAARGVAGTVGAIEFLEEAALLVGGDANAPVGDANLHLSVAVFSANGNQSAIR